MNTEKVTKVIAQILDASIKTLKQIDPKEPQDYDLVGLGLKI